MASLGKNPLVHQPCELDGVNLGAFTEIGRHSYLEYVEMGDYSYCGPFCFFQNAVIGKFVNIAASVRIGPTAHPMDRPTQHHFTYRRKLYGFADTDDEEFFARRREQLARIGHDSWIGHGAVIMPKVTVGIGAVVGAGAVVTKDVPAYTVAVGVPARIAKRRFPPHIAEALIDISWWDWTREQIRDRLEDFSLDIDVFVARYAKIEAPA
jgi:phosphonate metabolism protein (transferase hexapeptide repeat family)